MTPDMTPDIHPLARPRTVQERLIVALDLDTIDEAMQHAHRLAGKLVWVKVGSKLFTAGGPEFIKQLMDLGFRVFLDLKFHDIPDVVAGAVREATRQGVSMLTLHASGASRMCAQAREAASRAAERQGQPDFRPLLLGVTVLTSLGAEDVNALGLGTDVGLVVDRLASVALHAGLDGIVCSPLEIERVRRAHPHAVILTPGIRPARGLSAGDDQVRVATPAAALSSGADYLVMGRPILQAREPLQMVSEVLNELASVSQTP